MSLLWTRSGKLIYKWRGRLCWEENSESSFPLMVDSEGGQERGSPLDFDSDMLV